MEIALLIAAFVMGFAARAIGLPPLVGYLAAGFLLNLLGYETSPAIEAISDLGVLLLLFGIGLKLKLKTLGRPEVLIPAGVFALLGTAAVGGLLLAVGAVGFPLAGDLDLGQAAIVGFAFSFSSTVFAIKALEQSSETQSLSGRIAIGVLILQDIFAVVFLVGTGGLPSIWAIPVVVGMVAARPVFGWLLDRADHGEVQVLFGFTLAIAIGAGLFELVGLKADLGALVAGLVLSGHPRASEMSNRLLDFKDLFLVGFFLSIGLGGAPSLGSVGIAAILIAVLPLRSLALVWLFTRFRLRGRTALHTSLTLSTYSEFGLIVGTAALGSGLLEQEWVSAIAVAVAISFVAASIASGARYKLYERWSPWLMRLTKQPPLPDDAVIEMTRARVVVFGMGRIGTGAYDEMVVRRGDAIAGVDRDEDIVEEHEKAGRTVIRGDALDRDFWERVRLHPEIELVVAAMSSHTANLECVRRVREFLPEVRVASIAMFADQVEELQRVGVDVARNLYEEAGQGLADDACNVIWGPPDQS